jgi:hypothetical protein
MNGRFFCEAEVRSRLSLGKLDSPIPCQSFRGPHNDADTLEVHYRVTS